MQLTASSPDATPQWCSRTSALAGRARLLWARSLGLARAGRVGGANSGSRDNRLSAASRVGASRSLAARHPSRRARSSSRPRPEFSAILLATRKMLRRKIIVAFVCLAACASCTPTTSRYQIISEYQSTIESSRNVTFSSCSMEIGAACFGCGEYEKCGDELPGQEAAMLCIQEAWESCEPKDVTVTFAGPPTSLLHAFVEPTDDGECELVLFQETPDALELVQSRCSSATFSPTCPGLFVGACHIEEIYELAPFRE